MCHKYMIWKVGDELGLKYVEFEVPRVRNIQILIEYMKLEQFRKEIETGDRDFPGRTKCILFWLCNIF